MYVCIYVCVCQFLIRDAMVHGILLNCSIRPLWFNTHMYWCYGAPVHFLSFSKLAYCAADYTLVLHGVPVLEKYSGTLTLKTIRFCIFLVPVGYFIKKARNQSALTVPLPVGLPARIDCKGGASQLSHMQILRVRSRHQGKPI